MKPTHPTGRALGVLFLLPLLTYAAGSSILSTVFDNPNYLSEAVASTPWVTTGALLVLANSVAVVAIGVLLYPILAGLNKRIALAYVSVRLAESVLLLGGLISLLSLLTLSEEYGKTGGLSTPGFDVLAQLARAASFRAYQMAMLLLGLGSLGFCCLLYRHRLVPGFIALPGLVGYALLAIGAVLELFGFPVGVWLSVPGGLFEVALGIWLLIRGLPFRPGSGLRGRPAW
ncbi:DUF4386 domain-containing protein [Hymenobacter antarcticus]|uniref:DUF4386 domain-containing protein n=1 Tax=Hymenobacter antarcticus TaxID=486270 RepID=A0ABP7PYW8_9BACT